MFKDGQNRVHQLEYCKMELLEMDKMGEEVLLCVESKNVFSHAVQMCAFTKISVTVVFI